MSNTVYGCPHGVPPYQRCGQCLIDQAVMQQSKLLIEAFDRLSTVLAKLEEKL